MPTSNSGSDHRPPTPPLPAPKLRLLCCVVLLLLSACNSPQRRAKRAIWTQGQADNVLRTALKDPSPDERRIAVERIAKSGYITEDITFDALSLVLKTDSSTGVRQAAARALGHTCKTQSAATLVEVLQYQEGTSTGRPPNSTIRRACLEAIQQLADNGIELSSIPNIEQSVIAQLSNDPSRDVRIAAAQTLSRFQTTATLTALIDTLQLPDFGVAHAAEKSLNHLTGQDLGRDPEAWRQWLEQANDPFAQAGQLDDNADDAWWKIF